MIPDHDQKGRSRPQIDQAEDTTIHCKEIHFYWSIFYDLGRFYRRNYT
jgi:hypothetical protein